MTFRGKLCDIKVTALVLSVVPECNTLCIPSDATAIFNVVRFINRVVTASLLIAAEASGGAVDAPSAAAAAAVSITTASDSGVETLCDR